MSLGVAGGIQNFQLAYVSSFKSKKIKHSKKTYIFIARASGATAVESKNYRIVFVLSDSLYVIGGHDGTQSLSSVEVLDHPSAAEWRVGPSLTIPRANTHAVVVNMPDALSTTKCAIYAIGGFNGNNFLNSIEVLEQNGGW